MTSSIELETRINAHIKLLRRLESILESGHQSPQSLKDEIAWSVNQFTDPHEKRVLQQRIKEMDY